MWKSGKSRQDFASDFCVLFAQVMSAGKGDDFRCAVFEFRADRVRVLLAVETEKLLARDLLESGQEGLPAGGCAICKPIA